MANGFDIYSLQSCLFQLHYSVLTDCPIEGCKVCDSSVESCDECLEEKARFDPKSNSCTTISGQDMQVTVIIGEKYIFNNSE